MRQIRIFDTTLRDGEQAAGGALTLEEKVEIGRQLQRLGVDVIEAGFPSTSPGDFKAVETIGKEFRDVEIAALSGFRESQLQRTWEALKVAERPLLHTVISTSDVHIEKQLRISRRELIELTGTTVRIAKTLCPHVEFSAMDATRTDPDFVCQVFAEAIAAGATVINIPDSVGYAMPAEFAKLVRYCIDNVPGIDGVIVSVHCHDDLGEAVANSLAGVVEGVSQIECTINGVGERAGNASLEEIVMALRTRADYFDAETGLVHAELFKTSRMVSSYMGMVVPRNKAVVGANAFAHSSGLHQDGMLKERTTFEIMRPEDVGQGKSKIVLGKTSGRHAFRSHLRELGIDVQVEEFEAIFLAFKQVADRKKEVSDRDIEAILGDRLHQAFDQTYELDTVQVACGSNSIPTATVRLKSEDGRILEDAALGDGPVHAVYQAINRMIDVPNELTEFSVQSVTEGIDAIGEVTIKIESGGRSFTGHGADTDIIVASAKAYVNALNRLLDVLGTEAQEDVRLAAEIPAGN